ncbi:MAG TPA: PaaX family transcriptional regulator C-terminal domain-containing protein [Streptosporangiaceae bacterium]|nr:PaaX family transcriptional regulator C-terminal domain-containing protein [Streptosporangiaceae bacterium]
MNARSALFDLYGDHLRDRDGSAPIAAVVKLLAAVGIAAPAVRTAVSRMVRQGWLDPVRLPAGPGYALTPKAARRLDEAARRIYRDVPQPWDGAWHLLVVQRLKDRARRTRLRAGLAYLGYAPLDESVWISPRVAPELDALLDAERVSAERFHSRFDGDQCALVARAWDLATLGDAYERWLVWARDTVRGSDGLSDEQAFALRSTLVHEWRKFLFLDPGLPAAVLPAGWPGTVAAAFFDAEAARLLPAAARFVDRCLDE